MKASKSLMRKAHFLGTKIRNLRKRNNLTMEDLSSRCVNVDAENAPSVSYLSMIERGKRYPSEAILEVIAQVFHKEISWFLDGVPEEQEIIPDKGSRGGISGMALEPGFLFSNEILQIAIPEMLSQTGTTGRQFAHLLIRAYQEHHQNHFPDLERAAEEVGEKRMPLRLDDIKDIIKKLGLRIKWFDRLPEAKINELYSGEQYKKANSDDCSTSLVTSYFEPSNTIYLNSLLKSHPLRLKYDLAVYIGHSVLHNKEGRKNLLVHNSHHNEQFDNQQSFQSSTINAKDIMYAWRDFESSFFAGALLCPKVAFRQLLDRYAYSGKVSQMAEVSESVAMRRMTAVSSYPHWHYFDAFSPGKLKAVYRGNGIPLPWGNMRMVEDPCRHWAVFRMIDMPTNGTSAQLSILEVEGKPRIYCCNSSGVNDLTGSHHVLCAGIDLNPAIEAQGHNSHDLSLALKAHCMKKGGSAKLPKAIKKDLLAVAKILNIGWIEQGIEREVRLICTRGAACPRKPECYQR